MTEAEEYYKTSKWRQTSKHPTTSRVMGISYNPFLCTEAGTDYMNFKVAEFLKLWTEKMIKVDALDREKPSLGFLIENEAKNFCVPGEWN